MCVEVLWLYVGVVFVFVVFIVVFLVDSLFFQACSRLNLEPKVKRYQQTLWKNLCKKAGHSWKRK